MPSLKQEIRKSLKDAERIAVLGVGSRLRGDDAAGLLVAEQLKAYRAKPGKQARLKVFLGDTAPENLTGEIKKFRPTHVMIIDSADLGKAAGAVRLIDPGEVSGFSFATHQLPMKILAEYLSRSLGCRIIIIGIQPARLDFGSLPTQAVEKSAKQISGMIKEILRDKG